MAVINKQDGKTLPKASNKWGKEISGARRGSDLEFY